jgi:hypothetical protein
MELLHNEQLGYEREFFGADPHAEMTANQRALYVSGDRCEGEWGNTMSQHKEWTCECGVGTVRNRSNPIEPDVRLEIDCAGCREWIVSELACIFAGGSATRSLMPDAHSDGEMGFDIAAVVRIVEGLELKEQQRETIVRQSIMRAQDWIHQEPRAVWAPAKAVARTAVLDGKEAESIINANRY